jgi:predicted dehydrogenase
MTVLGLIGCGNWGSNWARTLAALSGVELRWCCDLHAGTVARIGREFPQVRTTTDVDLVLRDPAVDGVVVATVAASHFDVASRALEAGKHVLVEKPLTLNLADAVALDRLAGQLRRVLMVGHLLEYHPAVLYIKQMIDSGELGEVYYVYSQRLNLGKVRSDENAWWSLAPHDVSVALRLLGQTPTSVSCRGQNVVRQEVADVVFGTLDFPGGKLAHIHVSWLDPHKTRKLTVVGSKRMVVFDDTQPAYKVTVHDKGFRRAASTGSYAEWITMHQGDITIPRIDATEPLQREANHFVECVRTQGRPVSDGAAGAAVVAILEMGQRSLETGAIVPIGPLDFAAPRVRLAG